MLRNILSVEFPTRSDKSSLCSHSSELDACFGYVNLREIMLSRHQETKVLISPHGNAADHCFYIMQKANLLIT